MSSRVGPALKSPKSASVGEMAFRQASLDGPAFVEVVEAVREGVGEATVKSTKIEVELGVWPIMRGKPRRAMYLEPQKLFLGFVTFRQRLRVLTHNSILHRSPHGMRN